MRHQELITRISLPAFGGQLIRATGPPPIPSPPPANNFDIVPTVRSVEPLKDIRQEIASRSKTVAEPAPVQA